MKSATSATQPAILHAFKIDLAKYELRPLVEHSQTTIDGLAQKEGALIAVNASFFDQDGKPLGLLIRNGKILNAFKNISWWGIFYTEKNRAHIIHSSEYRPKASIKTALQTGPRLVVNGSIPSLKPGISPRTVVGITKKGNVILAATRNYVEITELAKVLVRRERSGGLGCFNALNLDGGSSTQLFAKIGSFELDLPGYAPIPVGLGVFSPTSATGS